MWYSWSKFSSHRYRYSSVENALCNRTGSGVEHLDSIATEFGEIACFAYQLLAQMCVATERHEVAAAANKRALRLNPFLWQPFTSLCNYGHEANPDEFYKFDNTDIFQTCQESFNSNSSFIFVGCDMPADVSLTESDGDPNRSYSIYATPVMEQHQNADDRLNVSFSSSLNMLERALAIVRIQACVLYKFIQCSNWFRFHIAGT